MTTTLSVPEKPLAEQNAAPAVGSSPLWIQFFKWLLLIAGVPIGLVGLHLYAEQRYPGSAAEIGFFFAVVFVCAQFFTMYILRASLEPRLGNMLSAGVEEQAASPSLASRILAWAVVMALTAITSLLLFDYYAHYRQALYKERAAAPASEQVEEVAKGHAAPASAEQSALSGAGGVAPASAAANFMERSGAYLGTFGDFFGGVVNPLLTFGTLVALAITMLMQRTQLTLAEQSARETLRQMHKQAFETTFFNLLNLHNGIVQGLRLDPTEVRIPKWLDDPGCKPWNPGIAEVFGPDGEPTYFEYQNNPPKLDHRLVETTNGRAVFGGVLDLMGERTAAGGASDLGIYAWIQINHNYVLGHYFRTLFRLLDLIDAYAKDTDEKTAKRYSGILRAQLSANELIVLFFNCCYGLVDGGQFRKLVVRYAMLEHMPLEYRELFPCLRTAGYNFEIERHVRQYFRRDPKGGFLDVGAFGTNPAAKRYLEYLRSRPG